MKTKDIKVAPYDAFKPYILPRYTTEGASGLDLFSSNEKENIILKPKEIKLVDTNISVEIPNGMEAQIRSRSGLSLKHGIFVLNSPGTIDSDYRGPIGIILANFSDKAFTIGPFTRIAQMVFSKVVKVNLVETPSLNKTKRDAGGFGSTGKGQ